MKLILIDDFDSNEMQTLKNNLTDQNITIAELDEFDDVNYENGFESVCVIAKIKYNFASKHFQKFIKSLIKNKSKQKLEVVFIEKPMQNAKIAIDWLASLKTDYNLNCNVFGEFDRLNLADELCFIKKALSGDVQMQNETLSKDNNVVIYTDGACSGNPGAGGWGAVLMHGAHKKEISGFEPNTTNNRMELTAVIVALSSLKQPCNVELYSDSAYVVNAIKQGWLENWKNNGWIGSDKKQVKNIELWQSLDALMQKHNVNFNKVKGHADNEFNNRCDALATGEIANHANEI